ncbi:MAG TPA: OmpH family outer membrane protein [Crocinitomix sp.]|nr:OmpH family outer membrane protein [Crocinitomix sp.]
MKKILLIAITIFSVGLFTANAQNNLKFAHFDYQKVTDSLPSILAAQKRLEAAEAEMTQELQELETEYNDMLIKYDRAKDTLSALRLKIMEEDIQLLGQKIQYRQQDFQTEYQRMVESFMKPIEDNVQKAIKIVAEKHKLNYVFEKSTLMYVNGGLDLTDEIRVELKKLENARTSGNN